jgi:outer membrane immunogenic protein
MAKIVTGVALILLATGFARAADLPALPPMAPFTAPPPFSFTGFYVGGNLGGAWAHGDTIDTMFGFDFTGSNNGVFIGGAQAGFNYQFGFALVGIEGDFDWTAKNSSNDSIVLGPFGNAFQLTSNNTWISTLAARFGFVVENCLLFYGKAGAGWVANNGLTVTNVTTGQSFTGVNSGTNAGWLAGFGLEWAFTPNWTVKLEYDYLGISDRTFTANGNVVPALAGDTFTTSNRNVQMGKVGVNYLFNWAR